MIAYAGSAGYYQDGLASPKFEPKYDVAGNGERQPGSAWKPILYATAFDTGKLTPGSLLLDITTSSTRASTGRRATPTSSSADRSSSARPSSTR